MATKENEMIEESKAMEEVKHGSMDDALLKAHEALAEAVLTGRWMVAVWSVKEGRMTLVRTSWEFPTGSNDLALRDLAEHLKIAAKPKGPIPLPLAADFLRTLRGKMMPIRRPTDEQAPPSIEQGPEDQKQEQGPSSMGLAPDVEPVRPAEQDDAT